MGITKEDIKEKIIETMLSVKVWIIFSFVILATVLLIFGFISATVWGSSTTTVISLVLAVREGFKVSKVKSSDDSTKIRS